MSHQTVLVCHGNFQAEIDELIAPLILSCWKLNIKTEFSCQNNNESGLASIQFNDESHVKLFLHTIINKLKSQFVPNKFRPLLFTGIHPYPCFSWKYEVYPVYINDDVKLMYSVLFPSKDINIIIKILNDNAIPVKDILSLTLIS